MKCPNCGNELEPGKIYCDHCGHEIQIVPDYDPLDELLIGREEPEEPGIGTTPNPETPVENGEKKPFREKKKPMVMRFRYNCLLFLAAVLVCGCVSWFSYSAITSDHNYSYQLRKGRRYAKKEEYEQAIPYLLRAQKLQGGKKSDDTEVFRLLADAYAKVGDGDAAVTYMEQAIEAETKARGDGRGLKELYLDMMNLLNETGQTEMVSIVIEDCPYEDIRETLAAYRIEKPVCDTPEGIYNYYLRLNLTAEYGSIYYTLDGTEPTKESTRYEEPVELTEEGDVLLCAVAINKKGMVSEPLVLAYKLDFPAANTDTAGEE